ncbi:MAG: LacI family DNA-binding transcriptional regulator [Bradyrhizobium sp.]|uniref:LacI family DNA-binding transcriptional regulator n=1 Tax=Bradyrhizobium sp. TaxID=376 RepID=UPI0028FFCFA9|nr:LacI family DNA-binding transcriptional regulator [Bradyrhizobium sp.]MDU1803426.1 LacI family DNA-binding transcriptional regulator [Bradyrhizobium sp.]
MRHGDRRSLTGRGATAPRPTIKDIAARCGVHPSTVSRALSPAMKHLVAADVAERIQAEANALGYRLNMAAKGLRTGRSGLIGVLAPDIAAPGFPPVLSGLAEHLNAEGYATIVVDVGTGGSQQDLVDSLIARGVDGLVLATVRLHDDVVAHSVGASTPVVLVNRVDAAGELPSAASDDAAGMRLAVDHLVALGHRRIGHVAGPQEISTGARRRAGFEASIADSGLSLGDAPIEAATAYTRAAGREAGLRLLGRKARPTAIVAANDLLALGVYDALAASGLTCPADVSVVGHNDMPFVDLVSPPLTTVRIAQREMGATAARLLLARIRSPDAANEHVVLQPELIIRASTARPRS